MRFHELEIKISIHSEELFQKTYHTCIQLFGPPATHSLQLDEYYDTLDGQLRK